MKAFRASSASACWSERVCLEGAALGEQFHGEHVHAVDAHGWAAAGAEGIEHGLAFELAFAAAVDDGVAALLGGELVELLCAVELALQL